MPVAPKTRFHETCMAKYAHLTEALIGYPGPVGMQRFGLGLNGTWRFRQEKGQLRKVEL